MTSILAQVTADPSAQSIKDWLSVALYILGCIAAVLVVLVYWRQLREKTPETPQPLIVQGHVQFVPRDEFEKEIKQAHGRMNRERDEARDAVKALATRIDGELETLTTQIATYNVDAHGRAERINDRLDKLRDDAEVQGKSLSSAIAAMPQQIFQLIKSAREI
jgi:hypothetical protein